jgi:hypothetical protein
MGANVRRRPGGHGAAGESVGERHNDGLSVSTPIANAFAELRTLLCSAGQALETQPWSSIAAVCSPTR